MRASQSTIEQSPEQIEFPGKQFIYPFIDDSISFSFLQTFTNEIELYIGNGLKFCYNWIVENKNE